MDALHGFDSSGSRTKVARATWGQIPGPPDLRLWWYRGIPGPYPPLQLRPYEGGLEPPAWNTGLHI